LCRETGCRVHIVHLATAQAADALRAARAEGLPITVETCPHYLYFAAEDIAAGATQFKCAPPIRDAANREALWQLLRDRTIDMIATDHSPCPPEMKNFDSGDFFAAWGGIASLSVSLPAVWTEASKRGFDLPDVVRWMSERPAVLAGLAGRKGRIQVGFDADFAVFDPDAAFAVTTSRLHFRHPVTPYLGEHLHGEVKATFVRGRQVYPFFVQ
jgi:allantoinase